MLHNLPPLPPIKGGDESTFPRASSARKYIQTDDDEGNDICIVKAIWKWYTLVKLVIGSYC